MTTNPLPPDVAAYLQKAAIDIAAEQDFHPNEERDLRAWMEANHKAICQRAMDAMSALREKLMNNSQMMDTVCSVLGAEVYGRIPKGGPKKWNSRYIQYATEHDKTPDEMRASESDMTGFLCWRPSK